VNRIRIKKDVFKPNCETSWVGECPWTQTLWFGSEDGKLYFAPPDSPASRDSEIVTATISPMSSISVATDPINEVAFAGDYFAASSRNEVAVGRRPGPGSTEYQIYAHPFIGGAHGVVASRSGAFLAPIADQGLLILEVSGQDVSARIASPPEVPFNFYRLIRLGIGDSNNAFAVAGRRDGLMALDLDEESNARSVIHHPSEGHDIVDVCSLRDASFPFAAACVSRDCMLFFFRNVLEEEAPTKFNLGNLEDTAYTLLSARGHLFLLTDSKLVVMPNLASRFLRGEQLGRELEVSLVHIDAAEAFLLGDHTLVFIEASRVSGFPISELVGKSVDSLGEAVPLRNALPFADSSIEVDREVERFVPSLIETGWQSGVERALVTSPAA
jgi:hypothetical protein